MATVKAPKSSPVSQILLKIDSTLPPGLTFTDQHSDESFCANRFLYMSFFSALFWHGSVRRQTKLATSQIISARKIFLSV